MLPLNSLISKCVLFVLMLCITLISAGIRTKYFNINGISYVGSFPNKGNWFEANRFCINNNRTLIEILSPEESERISWIVRDDDFTKPLTKAEQFWTSGSDIGSEGRFYWLSTGGFIEYSNWHENEPIVTSRDDNRRHCVAINSLKQLKWSVENCYEEKYFFCKKVWSV